MAFPTSVNDEQTNPTPDPGAGIENLTHEAAKTMQNAVFAQQQGNMIYQAATTQGVNLIYAVDSAAGEESIDAAIQAMAGDLESKATKKINEDIEAEQQRCLVGQAITRQGIDQIYSIDTIADAVSVATGKISQAGDSDILDTELKAIHIAASEPE